MKDITSQANSCRGQKVLENFPEELYLHQGKLKKLSKVFRSLNKQNSVLKQRQTAVRNRASRISNLSLL